VEHHIVTEGRPVTAKFRRIDTPKLAAAMAEFQKILDSGVIHHSISCWASPLHIVRKKGRRLAAVRGFSPPNVITTDVKYPLPNMGDLFAWLDGCTIFTKLDLQKGYFQVPVAEEDIKKAPSSPPLASTKS
jgi:hypothetical protein